MLWAAVKQQRLPQQALLIMSHRLLLCQFHKRLLRPVIKQLRLYVNKFKWFYWFFCRYFCRFHSILFTCFDLFIFCLAKNSSNVISVTIPPGVTPVMSTQYIMSQVPYFQQPIPYPYEDMQLLQQRLPHMVSVWSFFLFFSCWSNVFLYMC